MLQSFDPVRDKFLADLASLNNRIAKTQAQLTSGIRISKPSDDPSAVGDVLQLQSDIGRVTQVTANLNSVKSEVDSASGVVQDAVSLLDQARTLAAQGASATLPASGRVALAAQAEQILSALVNASRSTFARLRFQSQQRDRSLPAADGARHASHSGFQRRGLRGVQDRPGSLRPSQSG
jgi:Bacterial flagellin N-terminal helical region